MGEGGVRAPLGTSAHRSQATAQEFPHERADFRSMGFQGEAPGVRRWTSASGISRLYASAPAGTKNELLRPQTAGRGGRYLN